MKCLKEIMLPVIVAGIWINISEFLRWEFLVKQYWIDYFQDLHLIFPQEPINMAMWIIWGFLLAVAVFIIAKKYNSIQATFIVWFISFVMIWVVLWNANILPVDMLGYVVPLSLFEVYIAVLILKQFQKCNTPESK